MINPTYAKPDTAENNGSLSPDHTSLRLSYEPVPESIALTPSTQQHPLFCYDQLP
jgi:hypothetical protein